MSQYRAIRGMVDVLPDETPLWQMLEQTARDVLAAHGYAEIRTPIVESTELFARSIGEVTDIVEKEMYSFPDRMTRVYRCGLKVPRAQFVRLFSIT